MPVGGWARRGRGAVVGQRYPLLGPCCGTPRLLRWRPLGVGRPWGRAALLAVVVVAFRFGAVCRVVSVVRLLCGDRAPAGLRCASVADDRARGGDPHHWTGVLCRSLSVTHSSRLPRPAVPSDHGRYSSWPRPHTVLRNGRLGEGVLRDDSLDDDEAGGAVLWRTMRTPRLCNGVLRVGRSTRTLRLVVSWLRSAVYLVRLDQLVSVGAVLWCRSARVVMGRFVSRRRPMAAPVCRGSGGRLGWLVVPLLWQWYRSGSSNWRSGACRWVVGVSFFRMAVSDGLLCRMRREDRLVAVRGDLLWRWREEGVLSQVVGG